MPEPAPTSAEAMTPTEVAALAERATKGPWRVNEFYTRGRGLSRYVESDERTICQTGNDTDDVEFIAAARTHWPLHAQQLEAYRQRYGILGLPDELHQFVQAGIDATRIRNWWLSDNPKPPQLAFTEGPERWLADLLWAERQRADLSADQLAAALAVLAQVRKLCDESGKSVCVDDVRSIIDRDEEVCHCGMLMRDHHEGSSCTNAKSMGVPPQ